MAHAMAEYNSGWMKLATAAKNSVVPWNFRRKNAAEYNNDDDNRIHYRQLAVSHTSFLFKNLKSLKKCMWDD